MKIIHCLQPADSSPPVLDLRSRLMLAEANRLVGQSYSEIHLYDHSVEHYQQAYDALLALNEPHCLYRATFDLARSLMFQKNYSPAIEIFLRMLVQSTSDQERAFVDQYVGFCYLQMQDFDQAKHYAYQALDHASLAKEELLRIEANVLLAKIFFQLKDFSRAEEYVNYAQSVKDQLGDLGEMKSLDDFLADIRKHREKLSSSMQYEEEEDRTQTPSSLDLICHARAGEQSNEFLRGLLHRTDHGSDDARNAALACSHAVLPSLRCLHIGTEEKASSTSRAVETADDCHCDTFGQPTEYLGKSRMIADCLLAFLGMSWMFETLRRLSYSGNSRPRTDNGLPRNWGKDHRQWISALSLRISKQRVARLWQDRRSPQISIIFSFSFGTCVIPDPVAKSLVMLIQKQQGEKIESVKAENGICCFLLIIDAGHQQMAVVCSEGLPSQLAIRLAADTYPVVRGVVVRKLTHITLHRHGHKYRDICLFVLRRNWSVVVFPTDQSCLSVDFFAGEYWTMLLSLADFFASLWMNVKEQVNAKRKFAYVFFILLFLLLRLPGCWMMKSTF